TISAIAGTGSVSASLTVTPAAAPPPTPGIPSLVAPANGASVGQPIVLDWNDLANAASYDIQVDDNNNFTVPLVRSLTSTLSQPAVRGRPSAPSFWRVRGRNSGGVPGNWSSVRSFRGAAAGDTTAPPVSITAPAAGPASGTVTITANASDNVGVTRV